MKAHPAPPVRLSLAVIATLAAVLFTLLAGPGQARAQDEAATDGAVSWAVQPATEAGPDGRGWLELDVDPGTVVHEHLAVRNLGKSDATFKITAKDGYYTESGRFNMLGSTEPNVGAGLWIDVASHVVVAAGQTAVVPYAITVPAKATPGDHAAGIAASVTTTGTSGSGDQLQVESRMGFKVLLRATGQLAPGAALEDVSAKYRMSWNPFAPGSMEVHYTVRNTGNTRLVLDQSVTAAGVQGLADPTASGMELLPGEQRQATVRVDGVWPLVLAPISVEIAGHVPQSGAAQGAPIPPLETLHKQVLVAAMPWPQLLVLGGLALLGLGLAHGRHRRRKEVEQLIAQARREGELNAR